MTETILLVILEQFADWEAAYVSTWLANIGQGRYSVRTVSLTQEPVHSIGGLTVLPDFDLASVPADYAGLILVGGMSWRTEEAKQTAPLVHQALAAGRVVGGICDAAGFLATLGVLDEVRHTGNDLADIQAWAGQAYHGQANYLPQPAVRDGRIVTANGTAAMEFAREILLALDVAPAEKLSEWYDFYKLGCYQAPMPTL